MNIAITMLEPWNQPSMVSHVVRLYVHALIKNLCSDCLPFSIRILLESALRNCDQFQVTSENVYNILDWEKNQSRGVEIPFKPSRVILQDFT